MSAVDLSSRLVLAAAPAAVPAAIPAWGPPVVELFGANIPILSMAMSLAGLFLARKVSDAREGTTPGGMYLTGTLALVLIGLVIERQPTTGIAIAWGVGIGASGIVIVDLVKDKVQTVVRGFDIAKVGKAIGVLFGKDKSDGS